ncbi:hypothetical protein E4T56_gene10829 [Termitomyces sp. T112]|nr:hypothetical protein E4T56_gene10829 [Termitomyces sp. T112]
MATDLLERRSSIYSNRVRMPIINELMGWDFVVTWMPYGASASPFQDLSPENSGITWVNTGSVSFYPAFVAAKCSLEGVGIDDYYIRN